MNLFQFFVSMSLLSWRAQRSELPLQVFLYTFAVRIICQSLFFVWIARIFGGEHWAQFTLYGSILVPALNILIVDIFNIIRDEIDQQRLDLLSIGASSLLSIVLGRSIAYPIKCFLIVLFTYGIIGSFMFTGFTHWYYFVTAIPLLLVCAFSGYALSVFISSLNLKESILNMLPNFTVLMITLLANLTVPITSLPKVLQWVSEILPLRHAVDALRLYMTDHIPYWTNPDFYLEILLLLVYASCGYGLYLHSVKGLRKDIMAH